MAGAQYILSQVQKRTKTQKGLVGYANKDSVTIAQKGRKEKKAYMPQTVSQLDVADPGGPVNLSCKLQGNIKWQKWCIE